MDMTPEDDSPVGQADSPVHTLGVVDTVHTADTADTVHKAGRAHKAPLAWLRLARHRYTADRGHTVSGQRKVGPTPEQLVVTMVVEERPVPFGA